MRFGIVTDAGCSLPPEICREKGILPMPVCDLHGSVVLRK